MCKARVAATSFPACKEAFHPLHGRRCPTAGFSDSDPMRYIWLGGSKATKQVPFGTWQGHPTVVSFERFLDAPFRVLRFGPTPMCDVQDCSRMWASAQSQISWIFLAKPLLDSIFRLVTTNKMCFLTSSFWSSDGLANYVQKRQLGGRSGCPGPSCNWSFGDVAGFRLRVWRVCWGVWVKRSYLFSS